MNKIILIGLLAAAAFTPAVHAADEASSYIGVSAGRVDQKLSVPGAGSAKDNATITKFYGGFPFDNRFALELGYTDMGKVTAGSGTNSLGAQPKALTAAVVITQPLGDKFAVNGKLGLASTNPTLRNHNDVRVAHGSKSSLLVGVGAVFNITKQFAMVVEYESYGTLVEYQGVTLKATMASAGIRYKF
ncbi:MAG: outer membrane beta-barrel protein [Pseudomonadota bacterium]